ncbi:MAG TPA: hypothetical protein VFG69_06535 [Nannocystaceae bacterium]|nr:hypothetical protein [Nannocystaceae bacterium]
MSTVCRVSLATLCACQDIRDFKRRLLNEAEDAVAGPVAKAEADELCELAKNGATDYATLMQEWDPTTPYGDNMKTALDSVATSQRYDMIAHAGGEDWSCPELEPVLESGG